VAGESPSFSEEEGEELVYGHVFTHDKSSCGCGGFVNKKEGFGGRRGMEKSEFKTKLAMVLVVASVMMAQCSYTLYAVDGNVLFVATYCSTIVVYMGRRKFLKRGGGGGFDIGSIISLVVYIALIPVIQELFTAMSSSFSGTAGTIISAVVGILPLMLIMKALEKLGL